MGAQGLKAPSADSLLSTIVISRMAHGPIPNYDEDLKSHGFLNPNDPVAISFWIISISMVASTVFFLMESMAVGGHWKTSMNVGALVTLVAAVHYFYMREFWVQIGTSPILYRYIDWSITVPLQMIEFYLILSAVKSDLSQGMGWRLLLGTVAMLTFGYAGETGTVDPWLGFGLGMAGWGFILFEIFAGESASASGSSSVYVQQSFNNMRLIVSLGWAIYPAGYFFGTLTTSASSEALNVIYNIADFVNKIAFVLACWACAKSESLGQEPWEKFEKVCEGLSPSPKVEAARKLISNYQRCVSDATSQSPISQHGLMRVSPANAEYVEQAMREVARQLLGLPSAEKPANAESAQVRQTLAAYYEQRTQATDQQCPGRAADMSQEAAAAFVAAVKAVAK